MRTTIKSAVVTAAIVAVVAASASDAAPARPGTTTLLHADLDLPRHSVPVEGGEVVLQGGVTRDPDIRPQAFGMGRYPTIYFVRATNATTDTVWLDLAWDLDTDSESPLTSTAVVPGGFHVFFEPANGILERPIPVELRVFADRARAGSLASHKTQMKFGAKERRRLLKSIPSPLSKKGTEESFGHGGSVPIISGWAAGDTSGRSPTPR